MVEHMANQSHFQLERIDKYSELWLIRLFVESG